ncbi:MAG: sugar phosphate isomerase/epimerase [Oscillospiraceae bacterium]|jgi:sugar phosphate isomerase/epimerase|nr:sugar phosphate isomerase/epimerase [Oscillospiraceae bacterium]
MTYDLTGRVLVSTVAPDARAAALEYGLGIELAEFCTAYNMDIDFARWDGAARANMAGLGPLAFHAPFNELCPAAIDPLVADIARIRYGQAYELMRGYGIKKMVVHSGYVPMVYDKSYFTDRSVAFWREFLRGIPDGFSLLLENVMEDAPDMLRDIVLGTGDDRMGLCLDIGHAGTIVSDTPISEWINISSDILGHVHIHNNYRQYDNHNPPGDGYIDVAAALRAIAAARRDVTFTLESIDGRAGAQWLCDNGFLARESG